MGSQVSSTKQVKDLIPVLLKLFHKTEGEKALPV